MIQVNVRTNSARKTVTTDVTNTPANIFAEAGLDVSNSKVNLSGLQLTVSDMNTSFERLGVKDGASVHLNAIVKADGANK